MNLKEFSNALKKLNIPYAYRVFKEAQKPPYVLYYRESNENTFADNITYKKRENIILELYTKRRDFSLEDKIEKILNDNEIPFEVSESYISDEKMVMVSYYFILGG